MNFFGFKDAGQNNAHVPLNQNHSAHSSPFLTCMMQESCGICFCS